MNSVDESRTPHQFPTILFGQLSDGLAQVAAAVFTGKHLASSVPYSLKPLLALQIWCYGRAVQIRTWRKEAKDSVALLADRGSKPMKLARRSQPEHIAHELQTVGVL